MPHFLDSFVQEDAANVVRGQGRPRGAGTSNPEHAARQNVFSLLGTPAGMEDQALAGGAPIPQATILSEKPEHRLVILLKAQGFTHREIAERMDLSEGHVQNVLAQPWARQRLLEEIQSAGRDAVQEMFKVEATQSVATLVELRDDRKIAASVRLNAANSLLDRFLGKPQTSVTVHAGKELPDDIGELDRRIEEARAKQRDLIGRPQVREVGSVELIPIEVKQTVDASALPSRSAL